MKKIRYILLLILFVIQHSLLFGQHYCEVYQYNGTDSLNKKQTKVTAYNDKGQVYTETFIKWMDGVDKTDYYKYANYQLAEVLSVYSNGLIQKRENNYSKQGQVIEQRYSNFLQNKEWVLIDKLFYKYDKEGKLIDGFDLKNKNRYESKYNEAGKLIEKSSYNQNKLEWLEQYSYTDTSFEIIKLQYEGTGVKIISKVIYKLDERGRAIERVMQNENGDFIERTTTEYYNGDKDFFKTRDNISKTVTYDKNNHPVLAQIYIYR